MLIIQFYQNCEINCYCYVVEILFHVFRQNFTGSYQTSCTLIKIFMTTLIFLLWVNYELHRLQFNLLINFNFLSTYLMRPKLKSIYI